MARAAKKTSAEPTGAEVEDEEAGEPIVAGKKLVIVESPAKAKTINKYLGSDYVVRASMGHVRDLPTSDIGVDIEHGFAPNYQLMAGRKKVVAELKRYAKTAPEVFLATDLDREGEAIAWHLAECLGAKPDRIRRVIFNEITRDAIRHAFEHPRQIDMDKVNAQQARRILDRIVGYEVSPLLWRKVAPGLSAGRVQTVAVRLIVEREREIEAFLPEEYWKIGAAFTCDCPGVGKLRAQWQAFLGTTDDKGAGPSRDAQQEFLGQHQSFRAELAKWKGQRFKTDRAEDAVQIVQALGLAVREVVRREDPEGKGPTRNLVTVVGDLGPAGASFAISELSQREAKSRPPAPFITSSLQQTASSMLRFSAQRTMRTAQALYEGVNLPGQGSIGLITYMRTDSRHLSAEAVAQVRRTRPTSTVPASGPRRRTRRSVPPTCGSSRRRCAMP
jgi:DNA topoisomerase-1